jgi:hypothetical protein
MFNLTEGFLTQLDKKCPDWGGPVCNFVANDDKVFSTKINRPG